jgi:hypothetical protein
MSHRHTPGDRVGALLSVKGRVIELLGYGTYDGHQPIDDDALGWMADALRANRDEGLYCDNPRIRLDDGSHVWGCECWWGGERAVRSKVRKWADEGRVVLRIDINEIRRQYAAAEQNNEEN